MDDNWVTLYTKNCIVTGEPATCWGGHVEAKSMHGKISIIAGFKNLKTLEGFPEIVGKPPGYHGLYQDRFGVIDGKSRGECDWYPTTTHGLKAWYLIT